MDKNGRAKLVLGVEFIWVRCREKAAWGAGCAAQTGLAAAVAALTGSAEHQCLGEEL